MRDGCTGTNGRVEGEEDARVDDVEQVQLWRVIRELQYAAVNVGRNKKKKTCAVLWENLLPLI